MSWRFREIVPWEVLSEPIQRASFADTESPENLIREVIQNSLDAALPGERVRVRIQFSGQRYALAPDRAARWLTGLRPHLEEVARLSMDDRVLTSGIDAMQGPMKFLTIEDYGTTGLRGDITDWRSDDERNDFYWFWRNVGRSAKRGGQGGRWGIGKWVVPATSQISAFFALTSRDDSPRRALMGQAVLKVRNIGEKRYDPYGFYCTELVPELPQQPFTDSGTIEDFIRDFRCGRGEEAKGVSLVIPFPAVDIDHWAIRKAVLSNYFWALLDGQLEVEVIDGDRRNRWDRTSTLAFASSHNDPGSGWEFETSRFIHLAKEMLERHQDPTLLIDAGGGAPSWSSVQIVESELITGRENLQQGEPVLVHVNLEVADANGHVVPASFDVILRREPQPPTRNDEYIRDRISVPDVRGLASGSVRVLVRVDRGPLADLLADAEGPAHRDWKERDERVSLHWHQGPSRIRFIRNAAKSLVDRLSEVPTEASDELLQDVFFYEEAGAESTSRPTRGVTKPAPPDPKPRKFLVSRGEAGFRVSILPAPVRRVILVTAAYDRRDGAPFSNYDPADFDLGAAQVSATGGSILRRTGNEVAIECNEGEQVQLDVQGLDGLRDVIVRVVEEPR